MSAYHIQDITILTCWQYKNYSGGRLYPFFGTKTLSGYFTFTAQLN